MDWSNIGDIIGGIGSAASGGIFGLIGALVGGVGKYFQAKQEHRQKVELLRLNMEAEAQKGSWDSLAKSLETVTATESSAPYPWVSAVRCLYRPILTTGLVIIAYLIFLHLMDALATGADSGLAGIFGQGEIKEILKYIVYSLVFSTATAIVWWFGDRALTPNLMKK